jgi:hypothetical protein
MSWEGVDARRNNLKKESCDKQWFGNAEVVYSGRCGGDGDLVHWQSNKLEG